MKTKNSVRNKYLIYALYCIICTLSVCIIQSIPFITVYVYNIACTNFEDSAYSITFLISMISVFMYIVLQDVILRWLLYCISKENIKKDIMWHASSWFAIFAVTMLCIVLIRVPGFREVNIDYFILSFRSSALYLMQCLICIFVLLFVFFRGIFSLIYRSYKTLMNQIMLKELIKIFCVKGLV